VGREADDKTILGTKWGRKGEGDGEKNKTYSIEELARECTRDNSK